LRVHVNLLDNKIKQNLKRYTIQVSFATLALFCTFVAEQVLVGGEEARAIIVAAIASTAFILFISPFSASARPRSVFGGHLIAVLVSIPLTWIADGTFGHSVSSAVPYVFGLYAALGVGLTMFLMASTNTEHPPAAGTALAVVAHGFDWRLVLFLVLAIGILVAIQRAFRHRFINLY
jgi:CBS domain-containing membrane protein